MRKIVILKVDSTSTGNSRGIERDSIPCSVVRTVNDPMCVVKPPDPKKK